MEFSEQNGLCMAAFKSLEKFPGLIHGVTTRRGGSSVGAFEGLNLGAHVGDSEAAVRSNYEALSREYGVDLRKVVSSHQVHGAEVACVSGMPENSGTFPFVHCLEGYDGFITDTPGIILMVRVADCVPVILYEPEHAVVAVVHAGWRGTAEGIAKKAACLMAQRYGCDAASMYAGVGPSIGPCCYEVGGDVAEKIRGSLPDSRRVLAQEGQDMFALDLQEANRLQLIEAGLDPARIEMSFLCTACNLNLFFSHRGEQGKTGRFALFAGLRA